MSRAPQLAIVFTGALAVSMIGFSSVARTQGGTQTPPPQGGAQSPPATTGAAPAQGAGQGGGRGAGRGPGDGNAGADFSPKAPIVPKSAEEEAKTFVLPPGYRMELVLSEPDVVSPAVVEFDGNGRMYVAEFVTYMRDADGNNQYEPINRITRWESTKGDGKYDKHTVFVDKLVLPRMILPLEDGSILVNETASDDVVQYWDTNGDGVADKKKVFYSGVGLGRDGNLEHEQSGFVWGLDNWIYSTYNQFRFRWTPSGIKREPTAQNFGQWGLTQDDDGKMWFVDAGGERGPMNFQAPIIYGSYNATDQREPNYETVWPITGLSDTQGGMIRVRMPVGFLNHFTATCGPDIVRGDRLPADLKGDLLFAEPVGRLIRRTKIVKNEGLTQLRNAYRESEFILSSDPLFRPVNMRTAPDGTVYIADMYHGIIQESNWTRPNSYLRRKIDQYEMSKVVGRGRIWRLRFDGTPEVPEVPVGPASSGTPGVPAVPAIRPNFTAPRMYSETPAQLVAHFTNPNGFWRDMAQRLLVLKQDKSVVPALQQMARSSDNVLARIHAVWTLEGLGALDAEILRALMADPTPRIRVHAIRASETLFKAGNRSFDADYKTLSKDKDPDVAIQALLTLNLFKTPDMAAIVKTSQEANTSRGVSEIGRQILAPPVNALTGGGRGGGFSPAQQDILQRGQTIYTELCFTCHGTDGHGQPLAGAAPGVTMAPPLAGSPRVQGHRDYVIKTILHGLSGPVDGTSYTQEMVSMKASQDDWIASVGSFVRNAFGNTGSFITPADVARVRAATASRKTTWTLTDLVASLPVELPAQPTWKATASHNETAAASAVTLQGWNTAARQETGMWFQLELPEPTMITELQFDSLSGARAGTPQPARGAGPGGGGGARGAAGGAPPDPAAQAAAQLAGIGFPRGYRVEASMDGKTWGKPVAEGAGSGARTIITFAPVRAKFIRITQTATTENAPGWSISNLRVYQPGPGK